MGKVIDQENLAVFPLKPKKAEIYSRLRNKLTYPGLITHPSFSLIFTIKFKASIGVSEFTSISVSMFFTSLSSPGRVLSP